MQGLWKASPYVDVICPWACCCTWDQCTIKISDTCRISESGKSHSCLWQICLLEAFLMPCGQRLNSKGYSVNNGKAGMCRFALTYTCLLHTTLCSSMQFFPCQCCVQYGQWTPDIHIILAALSSGEKDGQQHISLPPSSILKATRNSRHFYHYFFPSPNYNSTQRRPNLSQGICAWWKISGRSRSFSDLSYGLKDCSGLFSGWLGSAIL